MRLYFKQRMFSWFDSYDIYDENSEVKYVVKGELSWGHKLQIYNHLDQNIATLKEKVMTFLPKFEIYKKDELVGSINKEFTFLKPQFHIDYNNWHVEGKFLEWDYQILDKSNQLIASITKEIWHLTDTYVLDIIDDQNALDVLLLVLAIDAEKCSRN